MKIVFEETVFDMDEVTRLYPAAIVKTGHEDETTHISLEWLDDQDPKKVEVVNYAIFFHLGDKSVHPFFYPDREALEAAIEKLAASLPR